MDCYKQFIEKEIGLFIYSPYSFLFKKDKRDLTRKTFIEPLINEINNGLCKVVKIREGGNDHFFYYKNLLWDSQYFNFSINRIELILYNHNELKVLSKAINGFLNDIVKPQEYYFINVPCEETRLIQALSLTGFSLVETRLNYYLGNLKDFKAPRHNVRKATKEDIPILKRIAEQNRNPFDRVHADPAFIKRKADEYLGTFIEESVKGFADMVIIPNILGIDPFGFLAVNKPKDVLGEKIAKLVLAAVDNTIYKGWLFKLLTEAIYKMIDYSTDYLTTITQASNRSAIRTWEKAGFKLGFTTHIYSYRN